MAYEPTRIVLWLFGLALGGVVCAQRGEPKGPWWTGEAPGEGPSQAGALLLLGALQVRICMDLHGALPSMNAGGSSPRPHMELERDLPWYLRLPGCSANPWNVTC